MEPNRALAALSDWTLHGIRPDAETMEAVIKERDGLEDVADRLTRMIDEVTYAPESTTTNRHRDRGADESPLEGSVGGGLPADNDP